jgi:alcohol dehydrogenase class IV
MSECRAGAVRGLEEILEDADPNAVVLFSGGESYRRSGAAAVVEPLLSPYRVERVEGVRPNPTLEDLEGAVEVLRQAEPDLVVAVGGGSVLDLAKAARGLVAVEDVRAAVVGGAGDPDRELPVLVAVPTTAGTGSEATHFSAVYVDGVKYSVGHPSFRPEHVLLDPGLSASMSPRLTAETGLDALAQAMESMWSIRSTDASRADARRALELAWRHLECAVRAPSPEDRQAMCTAAHLAGRAIDVSKTTASHALSYSITVRHGVAHGHAVALTLGALLEFNSEIGEDDCGDPRGPAFVGEQIGEVLTVLRAADGREGREAIEALVRSSVGITTPEERSAIVASVDADRLANNPRTLEPERLAAIVERAG